MQDKAAPNDGTDVYLEGMPKHALIDMSPGFSPHDQCGLPVVFCPFHSFTSPLSSPAASARPQFIPVVEQWSNGKT
jgi:hypothetical protein